MRLIDNKIDIISNKVYDGIYLKEIDVIYSKWYVYNKQDIWINRLTTSNNLIDNI